MAPADVNWWIVGTFFFAAWALFATWVASERGKTIDKSRRTTDDLRDRLSEINDDYARMAGNRDHWKEKYKRLELSILDEEEAEAGEAYVRRSLGLEEVDEV